MFAYRASNGVYLLVFTTVSVGLHAHQLFCYSGWSRASWCRVGNRIQGQKNLQYASLCKVSYMGNWESSVNSYIRKQWICAAGSPEVHVFVSVDQTFLGGKATLEIISLVEKISVSGDKNPWVILDSCDNILSFFSISIKDAQIWSLKNCDQDMYWTFYCFQFTSNILLAGFLWSAQFNR